MSGVGGQVRKTGWCYYGMWAKCFNIGLVWGNQRTPDGGGNSVHDPRKRLHGVCLFFFFLQGNTLQGALDTKFYKWSPYYWGVIFVVVHQYNYSAKIIPSTSELEDPQRFLTHLRKQRCSMFKGQWLNWVGKVGENFFGHSEICGSEDFRISILHPSSSHVSHLTPLCR